MRRSGLMLAALAVVLAAAPARAACKLGRIAELPVTMDGLRPTIHAQVNGTDAAFVVDSGAFFSTMSAAGAAQLKLRLRSLPVGFELGGIGGQRAPSLVTVDRFVLAGIPIPKADFFVIGASLGGEVVGLLGQNILRVADVEYDLANGAVRIIRLHGCEKADLAYWAQSQQPYGAMDISPADADSPHTLGWVTVNGAHVRALFDTGSPVSILGLSAARRAGIRTDSPGVTPAGPASGIGTRAVSLWSAPVQTFEIGGEQIKTTRLLIGDIGLGETEMLIGADFFLSHRVFIASTQKKLFFTYNGGPVFSQRPDGDGGGVAAKLADAPQAAVAAAKPSGDGPDAPKEAPKDATVGQLFVSGCDGG